MQEYNQLEIDSMHERLNNTRVPEDSMRIIRWKMRAILLPKYYDQKLALRLESYIVFTTKVSRRVEAWQWMPPPKSRNAKICKRKTFMISHIFFGIKASSLVLNTSASIFLLFLISTTYLLSDMNRWILEGIYRGWRWKLNSWFPGVQPFLAAYQYKRSNLNVYWFWTFFQDHFKEQVVYDIRPLTKI